MTKKTKQRMFGEVQHAAGTRDKARRVIARLEHGERGANPRFIVTDLAGSPKALYERRCCISLRRLGLQGTELAQACMATIRTKLLKTGAAVLRNTRRLRVLLASAHPTKHVFLVAAGALSP